MPGLPALLATCGVLAAAAVSAYYAFRVNTWAVMTDELQVARLAISIAQGGSPIPEIRGEHYGANSQLYPLLLAPFYGLHSAPQAVAAAHVLNALLLASVAVPAFLLARSVTGRAGAAYAAAVLTAVTPWLVLSSTLLTENAAYPAFVWSVFLCQQALTRPSPRRDALALAGLALAACSISHRSEDFACAKQSDCSAGRTCTDGFCVAAQADAVVEHARGEPGGGRRAAAIGEVEVGRDAADHDAADREQVADRGVGVALGLEVAEVREVGLGGRGRLVDVVLGAARGAPQHHANRE